MIIYEARLTAGNDATSIDWCTQFELVRWVRGRMLVLMAIDRAKLANDYSLVITSSNRLKGLWSWEIRRKSTPLGIKNYDTDFTTESAARIAGESAQKEFLDRLCRKG